MKNRKIQRYNHKIKEEILNHKDLYEINAPTSYEAVKNIKEFKRK